MRKFLALVLAMAAFAVASCEKESKETPYNPDGSPITQEQALEIVKEDVDMYDVVYVSKSIVKKGTKFKTFMDRKGMVPVDSWVVIINTEPQANSGPFWLYIYVDAYTGNADRDSWEWEKPDFEYTAVKSRYVGSHHAKADSFTTPIETRSSSAVSVSNNWAVIISGGANPRFNYERYWNDCSAIYKCLRQVVCVNSRLTSSILLVSRPR